MAGFKNAHTRAGFFEKLRQQGKYKEGATPSSATPGIPKIGIPKAPTALAPAAPKIKGPKGPSEIALMNLSKPSTSIQKLKDLNTMTKLMPTIDPIAEIQAPRFKKLKRIF